MSLAEEAEVAPALGQRFPTALDAHRATLVAWMETLRTERAELLLEKFSLDLEEELALGSSARKNASERRKAIEARLEWIVERTSKFQKFGWAQQPQQQPQELTT